LAFARWPQAPWRGNAATARRAHRSPQANATGACGRAARQPRNPKLDETAEAAVAQLSIENYAHVLGNSPSHLALCVAGKTQRR
jgi:hypothetical protein